MCWEGHVLFRPLLVSDFATYSHSHDTLGHNTQKHGLCDQGLNRLKTGVQSVLKMLFSQVFGHKVIKLTSREVALFIWAELAQMDCVLWRLTRLDHLALKGGQEKEMFAGIAKGFLTVQINIFSIITLTTANTDRTILKMDSRATASFKNIRNSYWISIDVANIQADANHTAPGS